MKDSKQLVKIMSIIVFIICIICVILLFILNKKDENEQNEQNVLVGDPIEVEYKIEKLRDATKFFSVQKYIKDNIDETFVAEDMNILNEARITSFAVKGRIYENNQKNVNEIYLIFRVDTENNTFLIEDTNNIDELNQIDLKTEIKEIPRNGKNNFKYETVTSEDMCRIYLEDFTKLELQNIEEAYQLIDEKYREERFPTIEEYQKYVEGCKELIETGVLAKYSVDYRDDYTEYVLVDNYNNSYILKETSIMNYTIMLDNYTIKVDTYSEDYKMLSEEDKVQSNVYIFLQMINTKDYIHAYELLDETFKNNNFATIEEFERYINQNFFNYNLNTTDVNITKEGAYYIYESTIRSDSSSAAETKKLTVIMKLLEGTDFVMSFSIE